MSTETAARIREASERIGVAESVIVRRILENGLARALDSVREEEAGRA